MNKNGRTYLKFDCGARLPKEGYMQEPYAVSARRLGKKPRKDGRYRIAVAGTVVSDGGRPRLAPFQDAKAPCGYCFYKKSSGRKEEKIFPSGFITTCYPAEMEE